MSNDAGVPDAARKMLARYGASIEQTEHEPDGEIDLSKSEVTNEDLEQLVFYPGFASLNLAKTNISDNGTEHIGQMGRLESVNLYGTLVSNDGLAHLSSLGDYTNAKVLA